MAAARILAGPLRQHSVSTKDLARVQRRRIVPTMVIQGMQRFLHERALRPALEGKVDFATMTEPPLALRILRKIPVVRSIPPFLLARGVLPEHAPRFARRAPVRV